MGDNAVLIFSFPKPKEGDVLTFPFLVEQAKKVFKEVNDVKIFAGINDAADEVIAVINKEKNSDEESNLVAHARRELDLLGESDQEFKNAIINSVAEFEKYGHSGGSASVAIPLLNDLLQFKNLTPLTNDPSEWIHHEPPVVSREGGDIWQSSRNSEAFSNDGGKTYYLLSEGGNDSNREPLHTSEEAK